MTLEPFTATRDSLTSAMRSFHAVFGVEPEKMGMPSSTVAEIMCFARNEGDFRPPAEPFTFMGVLVIPGTDLFFLESQSAESP